MATRTLKVSGVRDRNPEPSDLGRGLPPGAVRTKDAARVQSARAGGPRLELDGLEPDDVIEIELQDGLHVWSRVEDLQRDLARRSSRSVTGNEIDLPSELAIGPKSRSFGGWAIKALKVLGLDLEGEIAGFAASHVESKLLPGPGLYQCSEEGPQRLVPARRVGNKGPVLVFLHGTASSTSGSFSGLWTPEASPEIRSLFTFYDGRVFAYQHRTLTESPIENALALAEALAGVLRPDSDLHVVSHSRGGLIGELLARRLRAGAAPFTPDELELFEQSGRVRDSEALGNLGRVLEEADIRLTRFVRVACPARGTTLADRRLDRYFSGIVNLVSLIPALKANPIYDGLTSLLAGVLKKRTDPSELPGLEAMMPTSPLVRMLNNPDVRTAADLHVLGGDLAGTGLFGRLKTLVTDFYYREDHDVVVNTPAMLGGTERVNPVRYWIDTGDQVTHFHYFGRPDTARRLTSALTGVSTEFRTLTARPSAVTASDYRKRAALTRPVVVVLPGIMGSQLTVDGRPVWMNVLALARGGLSLLATKAGVEATGLLADGYAALCEHLKATHEVVPFPYDWRQPLEVSARNLRSELERIIPLAARAQQPVRLLAHSMGGLVVRTMLLGEEGRATWSRLCEHPESRFIMLGTPNRGSFAIPAMLMGRDGLVKKLALVDLRSDHSGLLSTIAGFDGVLHLLPHDGTHDFFDRSVWQAILDLDAPQGRGLFGSSVASAKSAGFRWALPAESALAKARDVARQLASSRLDPGRVAYVAGTADETACGIELDRDAPSGRRVKVLATARGDGRVLWETGIPKDVPTFYMDTVHGDMANDRRHFPAIVDLLNTGTTTRLPTTAPARRAGDATFEMREPMPAMVPDEAELVAEALGGRRGTMREDAPGTRTHVRLVHDNLTNARHPVLVSHYKQDVIVAAEKYLDDCLNGRLSELLAMELYPGDINTGVVVLNDPQPGDLSVHPGAIVAGLGIVGELTPGKLVSTLAHALTLYGSDRVGKERRRQQRFGGGGGGTISAPVTAILVGSGEGGLTLGDSVRALLRATAQANQRLRGARTQRSDAGRHPLMAQIDQLDIIELYEDRAIEAMYTLRTLGEEPEFEDFAVEPLLIAGSEGLRRARFDQAVGWWQRVRIHGQEDGSLSFEAVTQSARTPARLIPSQRGFVDGFVERALAATSSDEKLGTTLFELLVPNDFKPYAPDRQKLALILNPEAAALPWELMQDGFSRSAEPLSVASGMLRQLRVPDERLQVLRAPAETALVIGNPTVHDPRFPSLTGARDEAAAVADLLRDTGGYAVSVLLEEVATPTAVLTALHEQPWRILHIAAHGVFEHDPGGGGQKLSGLVLDDGLVLTSAEADQMRHVPELVFINCCHLGQTRGDVRPAFHKLAANLATQFIKMGARAVVAAGWAVDDAAAKTFATAFYRAMLQGSLYGDAVLQARSETFQLHGQTNTWGAYQCYGDPSFSLRLGAAAPNVQQFVAERELCVWLENLTRRARQQQGQERDLLLDLTGRLGGVPADWGTSSEVSALAGAAFAALGDFEKAVEYYERAVKAENAKAPISALEQLANTRTRLAGAFARKGKAGAARAATELQMAEQLLRNLLEVAETSERWSLLGGVMKRRALLAGDSDARKDALRQMADAYAKAFALSRKDGGEGDPYPLANGIAAEIVLLWSGPASKKARAAVMSRIEQLEAATRARGETGAFALVGGAERALMAALVECKLDDPTCTALQEEFARGLSRGASARVRDSIRTQFNYFRTMMETEIPEERRDQALDRLVALEKAVLGEAAAT